MFEQNLPTYIHAFLSYDGWLTRESPHYVFHYTKDSEAEKDIVHIEEVQEQAYKKIINILKSPTPVKKIEYYYYPDSETKTKLMGDDWYALAILNEWCVHVLYTKEDKPIGPHEDTHLLSLHLGQATPFIAEGLADYMVGHAWDGTSHLEYVQQGRALGLDLNPAHYLTPQNWFNTPDEHAIIFYSLAAAWTKYLIDTYGLDTYLSFYLQVKRSYTGEEVTALYAQIFETTLDELVTGFEKATSS
ncbi:MAG: hypothetical protein KBC62_00760 [Candidatus Pacebacteria bacterium]|nr:hypothetical protein [Candidatus Paceibacterota bacterium]